uniref:Coiled-coil domain-containing protein 15 n=1 Tax=Laticauda laticaudata TaxID=8630 RepID=A0A8C5S7T6_LATLA
KIIIQLKLRLRLFIYSGLEQRRNNQRSRIRKEKEYQRRAEEQRIQEEQRAKEKRTQERASHKNANPRGKTCEKLQQLKLEDPEEKKKLVQKNKEYSRYVEALRAQMREKIDMYNIHLPPLCFCGSGFWDTHPDSCANNCMFYKNHKGITSGSPLCFIILSTSPLIWI